MPHMKADIRHRVRLTVNGRNVEAYAEPRMLLSDFLRHARAAAAADDAPAAMPSVVPPTGTTTKQPPSS